MQKERERSHTLNSRKRSFPGGSSQYFERIKRKSIIWTNWTKLEFQLGWKKLFFSFESSEMKIVFHGICWKVWTTTPSKHLIYVWETASAAAVAVQRSLIYNLDNLWRDKWHFPDIRFPDISAPHFSFLPINIGQQKKAGDLNFVESKKKDRQREFSPRHFLLEMKYFNLLKPSELKETEQNWNQFSGSDIFASDTRQSFKLSDALSAASSKMPVWERFRLSKGSLAKYDLETFSWIRFSSRF